MNDKRVSFYEVNRKKRPLVDKENNNNNNNNNSIYTEPPKKKQKLDHNNNNKDDEIDMDIDMKDDDIDMDEDEDEDNDINMNDIKKKILKKKKKIKKYKYHESDEEDDDDDDEDDENEDDKEVNKFLKWYNLLHYSKKLRDAGLDSMDIIKDLSEQEIIDIANEVSMKRFERDAFIHGCNDFKTNRYVTKKVNDEVREFLKNFKLEKCADALIKNGFYSLDVINKLSLNEMLSIAKKAGLATLWFKKFKKVCETYKNQHQSQSPDPHQQPSQVTKDESPNFYELLAKWKLSSYIDAFKKQGYDDIEFCNDLTLEILKKDIGMKPVHAKKFMTEMKKILNINDDEIEEEKEEKEEKEEEEKQEIAAEVPVMKILQQPMNNKPMKSVIEFYDRTTLKGIQQVPFSDIRLDSSIHNGKKCRTILVIGATGTGKTTTLNSMVNYLFDVQFNDNFRYTLIVENFGHSQASSMTRDVTCYYLDPPKLDYTLCVVDTPGFADTDGVDKDDKIVNKIKYFFTQKIQEIDAICFVIRAPQARLTAEQQYIFNKVLSVFGNNIEENIFILLTFCDAEDPPALDALAKDKVPYKTYIKLNNSGFKASTRDTISESYWNMGCSMFDKFFSELTKVKTKSLALTVKVLSKRESLESYVKDIQPTIDEGFGLLEQIRGQIRMVNKFSDEINDAKDFKYNVTVTKHREIPTTNHTTTCFGCHGKYTCHSDCQLENNSEKKNCVAMDDDGNCTVCPGKCRWSIHENYKFVIEPYQVVEERETAELKKRFYDATKNQSISDQIIAGLTGNLWKIEQKMDELISNVRNCINELGKIALRPNVLNQDDYINQMIKNEQSQRKSGWQSRIQALEALKQKQKRLMEINDRNYNPWANYKDVKKHLQKNKKKYVNNAKVKVNPKKQTNTSFWGFFTQWM